MAGWRCHVIAFVCLLLDYTNGLWSLGSEIEGHTLARLGDVFTLPRSMTN